MSLNKTFDKSCFSRREICVVGYENYDFAKSLIVGEIDFLDYKIDLGAFDCLIFTSKNAVKALVFLTEKYPEMQGWKKIPSFVIGKGSAEEVLKQGGEIEWIASDFHSETFIKEILPKLKDKNSLYLRAKEIISQLDQKLQIQGIRLTSKVVYQSKIKHSNQDKPEKNCILLFTSPSAYRFFLQNFNWDPSYLAVALGKTTFASFDMQIQKMLSPVQGIRKSIEFLKKHF